LEGLGKSHKIKKEAWLALLALPVTHVFVESPKAFKLALALL
jgi:hypothetical protein